ncbi:hypothetical protein ACFYQ5_18155 [Streptomyces sp. NPDC005794]|uniref:hypothetical protein n=1 Tax=Streptomyces sp. NPDC005794 TaxID=3364733 RepID=UPI0036A41389
MGIESDQLVYDYLSRVGDLAQQQQLSSGARMRLVATLRGEIDRQRGTDGSDSPAVVRRILGRIGAPGELVAAAAESGDGAVPLPSPRADEATSDAGSRGVPRARRGVLRKDVSRKGASPEAEKLKRPEEPKRPEESKAREEPKRPKEPRAARKARKAETRSAESGLGEPASTEPVPDWPAASAPHMAGLDQAPSGDESEWWRIEPGPFGEGGPGGQDGPGAMGPGTSVPGFTGGLLSPELFGMPSAPKTPPRAPVEAEDPGPTAGEEDAVPEPSAARPRRKLRLRRPGRVAEGDGAAVRPRLSNPLLLLAAALLVAGAVLGSWLALAGGWLLAYSSRKFSRAEAKWVALGLPGVVVAGAFVWLWGRMEGRWGAPLAADAMGDAMTDVWPVVVRVAAVASALYLVWRARRLTG